MRIGVLVTLRPEEQLAFAQVVDDERVGRLEEHAPDQSQAVREMPVRPHRVDHGQSVATGYGEVVGAERRRLMNQTGAVLNGDVVGDPDVVRTWDVDDVERSLVGRV